MTMPTHKQRFMKPLCRLEFSVMAVKDGLPRAPFLTKDWDMAGFGGQGLTAICRPTAVDSLLKIIFVDPKSVTGPFAGKAIT
jgi:hypothetical protein